MCGLVFLALPIPVIVNNFSNYYAHAKARQKLKEINAIHSNLAPKVCAGFAITSKSALNYEANDKSGIFHYFYTMFILI